MEKENIISKVQKLLALSGSSNDHEAQSSLMMAQRLLAKYNLSMEDVDCRVEKEREVTSQYAFEVSAYNEWVRRFASVVAKNFRCEYAIAKYSRKMNIVFMGYEEDATIAVQVFEYACKFAMRCGSNLAQTYNDKGLSSKGIKQDYINGFIDGVREGWKKQVIESKECALMVLVPAVVNDYVKNKCTSTSFNCGKQQGRGDQAAIAKGYQSGKDFATMDKTSIE